MEKDLEKQLKPIISICKRKKSLVLIDDKENAAQWLGDGCAMYRLSQAPRLSMADICDSFGVTNNRMNIRDLPSPPGGLDLRDLTEEKPTIDAYKMQLTLSFYLGLTAQPLFTSQGIQFIDTKYLKPLARYSERPRLFTRTMTNGQIYFAAKAGHNLAAVISPFNIIDESLANRLKTLAKDYENALAIKNASQGSKLNEELETPNKTEINAYKKEINEIAALLETLEERATDTPIYGKAFFHAMSDLNQLKEFLEKAVAFAGVDKHSAP